MVSPDSRQRQWRWFHQIVDRDSGKLSISPPFPYIICHQLAYHTVPYLLNYQGRIHDLAMGGARFLAKRVTYTSEASYIYERSEYISAEFRTPESESERNLTNYCILFLLLFY